MAAETAASWTTSSLVRSVQLRVFLWIFGEFFPPGPAPATKLEKDVEAERKKTSPAAGR